MKMLRKNVKSFEQWCIENGKEKYLKLWDIELNSKLPKDVAASDSINKYYFKCEFGKHDSYLKGINNLINSKDLVCPECNSFYEWCLENDRYDLLNVIDKDIEQDIHKLSKMSGKRIYFNVNGIKYDYKCCDITIKNLSPIKKYYNSFGYYLISKYGDDAIEKYWSDKNNKSPFYYDHCSREKVFIKCQKKDYHEDYNITCYSFVNNVRCPMCASKIIHPLDSFAQYNIDRYGNDWVDKYWMDDNIYDPYKIPPKSPDIKVHIKCMNIDYHDFWITTSGYTQRENVCPCCKRKKLHPKDSFAGKHPEIISLWSDKNNVSPFDVAEYSHNKYWFKCENDLHKDYQRMPCDCFRDNSFIFTCPSCIQLNIISSYQKHVLDYFKNKNYTLLHENECHIRPINPKTGHHLRYDNEIVELSLIIEVHGKQHYDKQSAYNLSQGWKTSADIDDFFEYSKWKDEFKKDYAINHGYQYLELPYTTFEDNTYIKILDNTISKLESQNNQNP